MTDYNKAGRVIGLDLGDKESHYCELASVGDEMTEGRTGIQICWGRVLGSSRWHADILGEAH